MCGGISIKIAFCHHYSMSLWAGGEKLWSYLTQRLLSDGFEVEIHSLPIGRRNVKPILGDVNYSEKWFHNIDADVAYFNYSPYIEKFFKFKKKTPMIASIHGFPLVPELQHKFIIDIPPFERIRKTGLARSFIWWHSKYMRNFKNYDAIHIINPAMRVLFNGIGSRIYEIPNWIDMKIYFPRKEKYEDFTVLFASRDDWVKGIDIYNEIAKRKDLGTKFLATYNQKGNYDSLGFIKDENLLSVYSGVHATISPTRIDTFGNTIIESLSCGTPVITTRMPAHEALHLPISYADTPDEFLHEICKLKELWEYDRNSYYDICSKCRDSVARYDFDDIYPRFINMFHEVAGIR